MNDAPEKIWAGKYGGTWWQSRPHHQMTEYTRTDLHLALVAAAYKAAGDWFEDCEGTSCGVEWLTPDDAVAELERERREARIAGMRKAQEVVEDWFRRIGHGNPQDEIRAMIEKEQADG